MADASAQTQNVAYAYQQSQKVSPTVGGDAPWWDKGLSALVAIGSGFAALELQKTEINNAYRYNGVANGVYAGSGGQYSGATPWLGVSGPPPGGVQPQAGYGLPMGLDPMMLVALVALVGVGAFVLLRK